MHITRPVLGAGAAFALATILGAQAAKADTLHLDPGAFATVGKIDERFQSYNVEMAEVIGGKFWKPYAHMSASPSDQPGTQIQVGRDPRLFEARPPVDLYNHRLRALAAALGPAYIRVSGTWANSVYFQSDDKPAVATPPDGFNGVLTRAEWKGVVEFAKAVDAKLVTSFTISPGVRDATGVWTPSEARPLVDYTHSIGGEIFAAELFNEPNLASYGAAPKGYDGASFTRDEAAFKPFVAEAAPGMKIVGPGDVVTANLAGMGIKPEALLSTDPRPKFDVFSYHFYGAVSERCSPDNGPVGTGRDKALSEDWLSRTDHAFAAHKALRDQYAPGAPIWLTETAQAACGGSPWAATFLDTFRYLDQMGRLAKQGASAIFHNTLAASEYGLIDQTTIEPRPSYWAALLWRRLMGPVVLDAGPNHEGLHVYAQCLRDHPGGVALLAINIGDAATALDVSAPAEVYALTSPKLDSATVLLNRHRLALGPDDRIPALRPTQAQGPLALAPRSIAFVALPQANNASCR